MFRRRNYWIQPEFQARMIMNWSLLVLMGTLVTYVITIASVIYQDRGSPGGYFYVKDLLGSDPVAVKRHQIALPALLMAGGISFVMTCLIGVFYSHRFAGPIYRLHKAIAEARTGKRPDVIHLRKHDEFKDLAEALNKLFEERFPSG